MVRRPLGRTGLRVSPIGFGAFKIGRNEAAKYPAAYTLPDDAATTALLNAVLDLGVNLIDTAPAYGLSEQRIGDAIGHRRRDFVLCTKVGETFEHGRSTFDFSTAAVQASVQRSLRRLKSDVLDIVLIHSSGDDLAIQRTTDVVPTLTSLKDQGLIGAIGFSGKTPDGARAALEWADVLMVEHHPLDRSNELAISEAAARGVGVIVKKGLASGHVPADAAIPMVLGTPGVGCMVIGSLNLEHLRQNIQRAELCLK